MHKSLFSAFVFVCLSGCAGGFDVLERTLSLTFQNDVLADSKLKVSNPNFEYIRFSVNGSQSGLMTWGETNNGAKVFFSAEGEVISIYHGHILQSAGLPLNWQNARFSHLENFEVVLKQALLGPVNFVVLWDEMPGYRFGRMANGTLRSIVAPTLVKSLKNIDPGKLFWFEETFELVEAADELQAAVLPIRFAVDRSQGEPLVIFAEQCLSKDFCFAWQLWPVRAELP